MNKVLLSYLLLFSAVSFSHAGERSQIEAERMEWLEAKGIITFFGSVHYRYSAEKVTILADKLEIRRQGKKLLSIIAEGKPVHFEQLAKADELIKGQSTHLYYDAQTETVKLSGNAQLLSANNSLRGEVIVYDVQSQTAEVTGGGKGGKRLEAILQHSSKQDESPK